MKDIDKIKRIESCATIGLGALVFHYLFQVRKPVLDSDVLLYVAVGVIFSGLFIAPLGKLITYLWLKLADLLGAINTRIILSVAFFVFLVPLAFLARIFSKDNLSLKRKSDSYFHTINKTYKKEDLEDIF